MLLIYRYTSWHLYGFSTTFEPCRSCRSRLPDISNSIIFCVYLLEFHDHLLGQSGYHVCIEFNWRILCRITIQPDKDHRVVFELRYQLSICSPAGMGSSASIGSVRTRQSTVDFKVSGPRIDRHATLVQITSRKNAKFSTWESYQKSSFLRWVTKIGFGFARYVTEIENQASIRFHSSSEIHIPLY